MPINKPKTWQQFFRKAEQEKLSFYKCRFCGWVSDSSKIQAKFDEQKKLVGGQLSDFENHVVRHGKRYPANIHNDFNPDAARLRLEIETEKNNKYR